MAAQVTRSGGAGVEGEMRFLHKDNLEASSPPGGSGDISCNIGGDAVDVVDAAGQHRPAHALS